MHRDFCSAVCLMQRSLSLYRNGVNVSIKCQDATGACSAHAGHKCVSLVSPSTVLMILDGQHREYGNK